MRRNRDELLRAVRRAADRPTAPAPPPFCAPGQDCGLNFNIEASNGGQARSAEPDSRSE